MIYTCAVRRYSRQDGATSPGMPVLYLTTLSITRRTQMHFLGISVTVARAAYVFVSVIRSEAFRQNT